MMRMMVVVEREIWLLVALVDELCWLCWPSAAAGPLLLLSRLR